MAFSPIPFHPHQILSLPTPLQIDLQQPVMSTIFTSIPSLSPEPSTTNNHPLKKIFSLAAIFPSLVITSSRFFLRSTPPSASLTITSNFDPHSSNGRLLLRLTAPSSMNSNRIACERQFGATTAACGLTHEIYSRACDHGLSEDLSF